ncbi:MAG: lipid kinase [Salinisphaera sp.]|nr:lipid kinase [Salinisphaera sp.]MDN5938172.1 lipid kinase [Salinisphaera sp.]
MRSNALLLVNPNSRRGAAGIDAILRNLEQGGIDAIHIAPHGADDVAAAIQQHRGAIDRIIVGGGDGTMNAALPAVLASGLPMGVLPLGTANDFARSLRLPLEPEQACAAIVAGHQRRVDVGQANDRYFLNVAHIGFAVEVARRSDSDAKKRLGPLAYPAAAWSAFRTRRSFSVRILGPDGWKRLRTIQVSVGNGRFYGGGIPVAEDAAIDDGHLDLYAIPAHKGSSLLAMIPALTRGRAHRHAHIVTMRGDQFEVHTHRHHPKTVSVDGEEAFKTPVRFKIHPRALSVYAPIDP